MWSFVIRSPIETANRKPKIQWYGIEGVQLSLLCSALWALWCHRVVGCIADVSETLKFPYSRRSDYAFSQSILASSAFQYVWPHDQISVCGQTIAFFIVVMNLTSLTIRLVCPVSSDVYIHIHTYIQRFSFFYFLLIVVNTRPLSVQAFYSRLCYLKL